MQIDQIAVEVRPRTAWEGVDLGFAMARIWFLPLWSLWWFGVLPLYLLLLPFLSGDGWIVLLVIWWLKPLYEPPLVYWMGRAAFGERLPLRDVMRQWWRIVWPKLLWNLTLRRLDPNRSFNMPVTVLEGLKGKRRAERIRVLNRRQQVGSWLTLVGVHFEFALQVSILFLLYTLIPEEVRGFELDELLFTDGLVQDRLGELAQLIAMSAIAPFYVAGGFALYLTRRTELEAWDIEIHFRRMARARALGRSGARPARTSAALILAAGLAGLIGLAAPRPAEAAPSPAEAQTLIQEVLADEAFGRTEQVAHWRYIETPPEAERKVVNSWLWEALVKYLRAWFGDDGLAGVLEKLLWVAYGVALVWIAVWAWRRREWLAPLLKGRHRRAAAPVELFGLDLSPESLPEDVAGEALRLLRAGEARAALGLLYRASLARLIHRHGVEVPASATEGECLELVQRTRPAAEADLFQALTRAWLLLAYGHQEPDNQALSGLCEGWRATYGAADVQ